MGKINVLSFAVANLIAAGEVVDRPASVIKELMENAIDAGARHVTVEIQNGGVTFMRVSDDGCGMEADDLPVAIRRHATSKIRTAQDLDGISTLGFRGEALAAIASVSDLRILSKVPGNAMGAVLEAHGGEVASVRESGCMDGTTVIVEALFANVPARRKFLKKDATEAQAVTSAVERVALSHPEIAFKLITDGEIKLQTAGDGKLESAVYAVFGRDFAGRLLPLAGEYEGIGVSGFVGRSDNVKGNRNYQNFFINGRWIKSKTAMAALEQAYSSYLPPGRYPVCVLNLTLNPTRVDVNVHPAKLEVKFSNEKLIFEAVYYAVRQALQQNETRPDLAIPKGSGRPAQDSRRMSEAFAPVADRAESIRKRQLSLSSDSRGTASSGNEQAVPPRSAAELSGQKTPASGGSWERMTAEDYLKTYLSSPAARRGDRKAALHPTVSDAYPKSNVPYGTADQAPDPSRPVEPSEPRVTGKNISVPPAVADAIPPRDRRVTVSPSGEILLQDSLREISGADATANAPTRYQENGKVGNAPKNQRPLSPMNGAEPTDLPTEETSPADRASADQTCAAIPAKEMPSAMTTKTDAKTAGSAHNGEETIPPSESGEASPASARSYRIVGEVFYSYVIVEKGDRMLLIDKHAAHERVLFEELKARLHAAEQASQLLMLPVEVMLMSDEVAVLEEYRPELEAIGFLYTTARNTVEVTALPVGIEPGAAGDMLAAIADRIKNDTGTARLTRDLLFEKALFQGACKAAIKAGRDYAEGHIEWLVDRLMSLPDITFCPHGRPVALEMTKQNLDHQFERT